MHRLAPYARIALVALVACATNGAGTAQASEALLARPSGSAFAAGPLTQRVLTVRAAFRAAFAPKAEEMARIGFDIRPSATAPGEKADAATVVAGEKASTWAAIEAAAAAWLVEDLAYASLGLPSPGAAKAEPKAKALAGFALTHALGFRRLRAMMTQAEKAYVTAAEGALTEIEEALVATADKEGLPEGLTWAALGYDDAYRKKARERLAHADETDYRRVYKNGDSCAAMVGFVMRTEPVPVFVALPCTVPAAGNDEMLRGALEKAKTLDDARKAVAKP